MTTTTRERPIIFSGPMVRAILDGRKTQTRRLVRARGIWSVEDRDGQPWPGYEDDLGEWQWMRCPFGEVGTTLWVREKHARFHDDPLQGVHYYADGPRPSISERHNIGLLRDYPSIHMPRWASRITLEVTDVRVERLQDISEADAKAEGVDECVALPGDRGSFVQPFAALWESINGSGSWESNPWVWVIQFKMV